jgi:hypothetical protein
VPSSGATQTDDVRDAGAPLREIPRTGQGLRRGGAAATGLRHSRPVHIMSSTRACADTFRV